MTKARESEIMLGLLEAVEAGSANSQRHLASDLGIALGLVNIYMKRCIKKGLIKVSQAPARRYAYYLTPSGFAEKSRLTQEYLSWSLTLFRRARSACESTLHDAAGRGWKRVAIAGCGDLAEVVVMCARELGLEVVAVVDPDKTDASFAGLRVMNSFADAADTSDGIIVTDLYRGSAHFTAAEAVFGPARVLVPSLVAIRPGSGADTVVSSEVKS